MPILLNSEILNPKHEMVRPAHHPEPSRRANSKHEFFNVQNILTLGSMICFGDLNFENWRIV
jgi:hypothetical protein